MTQGLVRQKKSLKKQARKMEKMKKELDEKER